MQSPSGKTQGSVSPSSIAGGDSHTKPQDEKSQKLEQLRKLMADPELREAYRQEITE